MSHHDVTTASFAPKKNLPIIVLLLTDEATRKAPVEMWLVGASGIVKKV
jgi:hypothetical protein